MTNNQVTYELLQAIILPTNIETIDVEGYGNHIKDSHDSLLQVAWKRFLSLSFLTQSLSLFTDLISSTAHLLHGPLHRSDQWPPLGGHTMGEEARGYEGRGV